MCSESDQPALWAYHKLQAAGLVPIDLVTTGALAQAKSWEHRLNHTYVQLTVELDDGRRFYGSEIQGVLNRLLAVPPGIVKHAIAEDREYAAAELTAFYLGWLHSLQGVINAATPQGLCGAWRHPSEWAVLAARAGFKVPSFRQTSVDPPQAGLHSLARGPETVRHVIVLRHELYAAAVPREVGLACRTLARLAAIELLGIDLLESEDGGLMFVYATPFPDLTLGGDGLIEGLARAFRAPPPP